VQNDNANITLTMSNNLTDKALCDVCCLKTDIKKLDKQQHIINYSKNFGNWNTGNTVEQGEL